MLIHIDTKGYTEKPKEHISIIKPRLQGANTIKDIDLETLIKYIQRGYSISPAVMDGKGCKAENWKEQRLFMVDIDNDKSDNKGFIVVSGRVPKKYFNEKFYC